MKFCFQGAPRKTAYSAKANYSCFDEINTCADVSFRMISFRVVLTWQYISRNEISCLSKWLQWNNNGSEFNFVLYQKLTSYKKLTSRWNENIWFHPKWNLMQTPSNIFSWLVVFIMGIWRPHCPKHLQLFLFFEF